MGLQSSPLLGIKQKGGGDYDPTLDAEKTDAELAIPDCKTFAAVIKQATGHPVRWAQCVNPTDDPEFLKACVGSVSPSLVNPKRIYLPSCEEIQKAYQIGIDGAADTAGTDPTPPTCEFVRTAAISWRDELPEFLKGCAGYDPNHTAEHLPQCLSEENELVRLTECRGVQYAYERKVTMAHGYTPEEFFPVPCDQTKPLLEKAEHIREKRKAEAIALAKALAERKRKMKKAREDYIKNVKQSMAEKYQDTPERVAARMSQVEKQIRAQGGKVTMSCASPPYKDFYCPPTREEIRLAMMRHIAGKFGAKVVDGHLVHGTHMTPTHTLICHGWPNGQRDHGE